MGKLYLLELVLKVPHNGFALPKFGPRVTSSEESSAPHPLLLASWIAQYLSPDRKRGLYLIGTLQPGSSQGGTMALTVEPLSPNLLHTDLLTIKHTSDPALLFPSHAYGRGGVGHFL